MFKCYSVEVNFFFEILYGIVEVYCWFEVWFVFRDILDDGCICERWYYESISVNIVLELKYFNYYKGSFRFLVLRIYCVV